MKQLAIFASGKGSNASAIMDYFQIHPQKGCVRLVVSNRQDSGALNAARERGIEALYVPNEVFNENPLQILSQLQEREIDFIALAGFLKLVPSEIVEHYSGRIVNIHPALLPKFGGKGMYGLRVHQAVVEAEESETGITIHSVDKHYDEGSVIFQAKVPVLPQDSPQDVAARVLQEEHYHYPRVICELLSHIEQ